MCVCVCIEGENAPIYREPTTSITYKKAQMGSQSPFFKQFLGQGRRTRLSSRIFFCKKVVEFGRRSRILGLVIQCMYDI